MNELIYKISFLSDWHCSSGLSSGSDVDSLVIKDKNGLPFLPGKTFKGLIKEAANTLAAFSSDKDREDWEIFIKEVFGIQTDKHLDNQSEGGMCYFSDAVLSGNLQKRIKESDELKSILYRKVSSTAIDEYGIAKDHSLRKIEVTIPLTIYGKISHLKSDHLEKIKQCLKLIKRVGLGRNRGLGRCCLSVVKESVSEEISLQESKDIVGKGESQRYYKCSFLTDIILKENAATEGNSRTLDYIPGANFLGIVAKHYKKLVETQDIFHSGKVRFGDGHIAENGKRSLKRPANWYYDKMDEEQSSIFLHQMIEDNMWETFTTQGKQLKQIRERYFIIKDKDKEVSVLKSDHAYSLKSAYDIKNRRSKDEAMYGYDALRKGSEWIFSVEGEPHLLGKIEPFLVGEKSIGRSKTAQYGRVMIERIPDHTEKIETNDSPGFLYIYFESKGCFIDCYGQPTFMPSLSDLKLPKTDDYQILWDKSQILTKSYAPWNGQRKTRDFDRVCIDKGSVIVVKVPESVDFDGYRKEVSSGIGYCKNEGFGRVLVNPDFVVNGTDEAMLDFKVGKRDHSKDTKLAETFIVAESSDDQSLLDRISSLADEKSNQLKVLEAVNSFSKKYGKLKNISASQWGMVRSLATRSQGLDELNYILFDRDKGFLMKGKSEKDWRPHIDKLKNFISELADTYNLPKHPEHDHYAILAVINLASSMAKLDEKGGK